MFEGDLNFREEGYTSSTVQIAHQIFSTITPY